MKNVLLIGVGRFGVRIAEKLVEMKHEVLAVDIHENLINEVAPLVTEAQIGDCTDKKFLSTFGVNCILNYFRKQARNFSFTRTCGFLYFKTLPSTYIVGFKFLTFANFKFSVFEG